MSTVILTKEDIYKGNLILINRAYKYRELGQETLIPVQERHSALLRRSAAVLLTSLMETIHGWRGIVPVSGWRSMEEQQQIWDSSLEDSGQEFTERFVAFPGHSEHQTGLAIDLGLKKEEIDFICPEFPYKGICQTFRENAAAYGFVERYPAGKEKLTGIGHEPWHFRYVGVPHAMLMAEKNMVLEEYVDFLKGYVYGQKPYKYEKNGLAVDVSYLKGSGSKTMELEIDTQLPYSVSGNNVDGYIITQWRGKYGGQKNLRWA